METSNADVGDRTAWVSVLVVFVAATLGLRCLLAAGARGLLVLPGGHTATIEEAFNDGLAEALEQEDTTVMRVVYVVIVAFVAIELGGVNVYPAHQRKLRLGCLVLLSWRTAAVVSCILTSVLDSLLLDDAGGEPGLSMSRRKSIKRRKSFMAGLEAEHRAHRVVCGALTAMIYVVASVFVLDNIGIQVSGLVSYMGFLGLALSLGAQYMLQDLLGYCAVMVDASIVIGDQIIVGSDPKGTVEAIGYLSTKVRTLDGELLLYRNRDFAAARVTSCSRRPHRLVTMEYELAATTPAKDLEVARDCAQRVVEELATQESKVAPDLGGSVRWSEYKMRFYAAWIDALAQGEFGGVRCSLLFYLDGTAGKPLENEAKTLVFLRLAQLLEERGVRTQGALL
eukprot:CAMPEP_0204598870 /NCGR_PEP_ID=MMETSP0661-20131031/54531_1 /ASSEMBLY_ACC=CAM_ASM_000606 /TAXON_ID=109239 /ORGANISM="Alexandrium margalefi, Strain AMGDE01CS-322" /LENGTH=395 /DNA_ID=CAMNT_0051609579 /DNA_START=34 /DNA_END=1218 /DNA_ORIENTATION=+